MSHCSPQPLRHRLLAVPLALTVLGGGLATAAPAQSVPRDEGAGTVAHAGEAPDLAGDDGESPAVEPGQGPCVQDFWDATPQGTFYDAITWMACDGITVGLSDGSFGTSRTLTRGEAAQFLYRMSGERHRPGTARDFTDVDPGRSAFTAISWMEDKGYTAGYSNGAFGIDDPISRGQLAAFMVASGGDADYRAPAVSPYPDLAPGAAFYRAAAWLHATGLVTGYRDGTFRSDREITRGEAAQFLYALQTHLHGRPAPPQTPPKPAVTQANRYVVIENDLNLRSGPAVSHGVVKVLPRNARVQGTGTVEGEWYHVVSGPASGWVHGSYLMGDFEAGTAKSAQSARARVQEPATRNGVTIVPATWAEQPNGRYCGPASLKIVLSAFGIDLSQEDLARQANTSRLGTWLHEVGRVLDYHAPAGVRYSVTTIPGEDATAAQRKRFRQDMQRTVEAGVPAVINLAATPAEQPGHYPRGATLYHHFVVVGYNDRTDEVLVYDPWNYGNVRQFWVDADRVADMAGERGYVSLK